MYTCWRRRIVINKTTTHTQNTWKTMKWWFMQCCTQHGRLDMNNFPTCTFCIVRIYILSSCIYCVWTYKMRKSTSSSAIIYFYPHCMIPQSKQFQLFILFNQLLFFFYLLPLQYNTWTCSTTLCYYWQNSCTIFNSNNRCLLICSVGSHSILDWSRYSLVSSTYLFPKSNLNLQVNNLLINLT